MALPGQSLGPFSANDAGTGTHIHASQLHASLGGQLLSRPSTSTNSKRPTVSVARLNGALVPETGIVVLGKITRTNPRQATLSILAIGAAGEHLAADAFPGLIRQQDIRATEIDKVKVAESFRVGDVVRAVVISLGDERSYYLSTAKNELGVVMAVSEHGNQMVPVSWREFMDPVSGAKETRKVAKPYAPAHGSHYEPSKSDTPSQPIPSGPSQSIVVSIAPGFRPGSAHWTPECVLPNYPDAATFHPLCSSLSADHVDCVHKRRESHVIVTNAQLIDLGGDGGAFIVGRHGEALGS
nr:exosome complex component csl4 [Quercus suber]